MSVDEELIGVFRSARAAMAVGDLVPAAEQMRRAEQLLSTLSQQFIALGHERLQTLVREHAEGVAEMQRAHAELAQRSQSHTHFTRAAKAYVKRRGR